MWKRAASYPPAAMPRVSHPGHRTVAWLSPDWPSRYAAAGAPVVWLTALGIWASVLAGIARRVCSGSRRTPEPVASSLMRRVSAPAASEVRSKMSAWPRFRVAVVPSGGVRMTSQVVTPPVPEAVAASVAADAIAVESVAVESVAADSLAVESVAVAPALSVAASVVSAESALSIDASVVTVVAASVVAPLSAWVLEASEASCATSSTAAVSVAESSPVPASSAACAPAGARKDAAARLIAARVRAAVRPGLLYVVGFMGPLDTVLNENRYHSSPGTTPPPLLPPQTPLKIPVLHNQTVYAVTCIHSPSLESYADSVFPLQLLDSRCDGSNCPND